MATDIVLKEDKINVIGDVEVQKPGQNQATIRFIAKWGNIHAGGNGTEGDLILKDGDGNTKIHLNAAGGIQDKGVPILLDGEERVISVRDDSKEEVFRLSPSRMKVSTPDVVFELPSAGGLIIETGTTSVQFAQGEITIIEDGDVISLLDVIQSLDDPDRELVLRNDSNKDTIIADGKEEEVTVGYRHYRAHIKKSAILLQEMTTLPPSAEPHPGPYRIFIGSPRGDVLEPAGDLVEQGTRVILTSDGSLSLGGDGEPGEIRIKNAHGQEWASLRNGKLQIGGADQEVSLGGPRGSVVVNDERNRPAIRLEGIDRLVDVRQNASMSAIRLEGNDNRVELRDQNNNPTIQLEGIDGTVSAKDVLIDRIGSLADKINELEARISDLENA